MILNAAATDNLLVMVTLQLQGLLNGSYLLVKQSVDRTTGETVSPYIQPTRRLYRKLFHRLGRGACLLLVDFVAFDSDSVCYVCPVAYYTCLRTQRLVCVKYTTALRAGVALTI